jgi:hypothetical protein
MREIKISLETAQRWYNGQNTELKELAVQTYPELVKKELPSTWKELGNLNGYYVASDSSVDVAVDCFTEDTNKNVFTTKEQAEASIALAQLSQLLAVYNDGSTHYRNVIRMNSSNEPYIYHYTGLQSFLLFKDYETAKLFLTNFKDLILIAKPLL